MTTPLPLHCDIPGFDVRNNCLVIGGRKVTELVDDSAAYLYDPRLMRDRVSELRGALPEGVQLHYAIKANPMPEVVQLMATLVDGLDVASAGELEVALTCQLPREEMSFAGPGKTDSELEAAIRAGVVINLESPNEIRRAGEIAARLERQALVALRVNPDFELKGSGMRMSGGAKPFGIDAEQIPEVIGAIGSPEFDFQGFHIFAGSQSLNAEAICEAQSSAVDLALRFADRTPKPPRFVNIGGGFGIPYFKGDKRLDLKPIGDNLAPLQDRLHAVFPDAALVIELGRYLVGEAGIYVCRVVDKKVSRGHTFLVTNGGLHHHLAASGNFGQVIRKNYPVLIGNRVTGANVEKVTIVGPLCTPLDILASDVELPEAEVGDLVVVFQSGAYGLTASPRAFLGHPDAAERLLP